MLFCTLFNAQYLPQGIALYHSLERVSGEDFILYVLCMDDYTYEVLAELKYPSLKLIALREIEDDRLRAVRDMRTVGEYCWTCTSPLLLHLLQQYPAGTVLTYVDADLQFLSDPALVLEELGANSILIHEHDFAPEYAHLASISGRFNVGLVSFRNNDESRRCLRLWQEQCLNECVMDPQAGKCGDQNYLDEWPSLYPGLVISSNPGVGLAPWNISKHKLRETWSGITVDNKPVVFYHFHQTRPLRPRAGVKPIIMAQGQYRITQDVARLIYRPYASALYQAARETNPTEQIEALGHRLTLEMPTLPDIYRRVTNQQLLFSVGEFSLPLKYNPQAIRTLYGIDPHRDEM